MNNPLNPSNDDRYLSAVQFGLLRAMDQGVRIKMMDCPGDAWKDTLFLFQALGWATADVSAGTVYSITDVGRQQVAQAQAQQLQMTETFGIFQFVCLDTNVDAPTFAYANFAQHNTATWEDYINTEYEPVGFPKQKLFGDYRFAVVEKKHGKQAAIDWVINQTLFSVDPAKRYFRVPANDNDLGEVNFDLLNELIWGGPTFPGIEGVVSTQYKWTDITEKEEGFNAFVEDAAKVLLALHQNDQSIARVEQELADAQVDLSGTNNRLINAENDLLRAQQAPLTETVTEYYTVTEPVIWSPSIGIVLTDWYFGYWYPSPYWGQAWVVCV